MGALPGMSLADGSAQAMRTPPPRADSPEHVKTERSIL